MLAWAEAYETEQGTDYEKVSGQMTKQFVIYRTLEPTGDTRVEDRGVRLTLRYLCHPRRRRDSESQFFQMALDKLGPAAGAELVFS